jgi:hypothetical protein
VSFFNDLFNREVEPGDPVIFWTDQGGRSLKAGIVVDVRERQAGPYLVIRGANQDPRDRSSWRLDRTSSIIFDENRVMKVAAFDLSPEACEVLQPVKVSFDPKTTLYPHRT